MADNSTSPDLGVGSSPPPEDQSGGNSTSSSNNNNAGNSGGQDNNNNNAGNTSGQDNNNNSNNDNSKGNNEGQGQRGEVQVQVPPGNSEGQGRGGEVQAQVPPGNSEGRGRGGEVQVQVPPGSGSQVENSPPLGGNNKDSGYKSSSSSSSGSLSSAKVSIIAGIVGLVVILILLAIICIMCKRRRKRKRMDSHPYYGWQSGPNQLHKGNQQWQPPTKDHHTVKIPPPSGGGWPGKATSGAHTSPTNNNNNSSSNNNNTRPSPVLQSSPPPPPSFKLGGFNKSTFTYEELASATKGFDQSNMLGQGGFGYVHKGVLPNGKEVAVKSLKSGSGQGDREFHAEVEIITRVHHKHLVTLVGYCISKGQRLLVYEFVPNNTLEFHLHNKNNPPLDFSTRLRIALGSAKGLAYLHEDCHPRIIHRDIKASNILLEDNFEAMVADFGLAKLTSDNNTHVSTRVMGTFGYLAPEYASSGKLTEKSDVFSFGVMLLELITGRRPVDPDMKYMEDSLVDWSRPLLAKALETGNYRELADPRLEGNYNAQEMQRMVACAAASIRHSSKKRPKMSQIVRALEGDVSLEDLNDGGPKAGHHSVLSSSDTSSDFDSRQYSMDLRKFRQMAFDTQDFASSEYGGTRDYGTNSSMSSGPNMH